LSRYAQAYKVQNTLYNPYISFALEQFSDHLLIFSYTFPLNSPSTPPKMRTSTSLTLALACLFTTSLAAPTPRADVTSVLGSITNPSALDLNKLIGNLNGNGNGNGNGNSAGEGNGNDNVAGSGNTISLKERELVDDVKSILGSITNPSALNGNTLKDNLNGVCHCISILKR
jgi:hypothetical protein